MDEINNPTTSTSASRENFTRREIAQDFLRQHLPAELLEVVDLESLEISKDSYVSKELRTSYSDLVYRLRWRMPDEADPAAPERADPADVAALDPADAAATLDQTAPPATLALHVYILFEHKSHTDYWVLLQLLRYIALQGGYVSRSKRPMPRRCWRGPIASSPLRPRRRCFISAGIGRVDWAEDRLIPDAVRAWNSETPLQVRRPEATRPWQHMSSSP